VALQRTWVIEREGARTRFRTSAKRTLEVSLVMFEVSIAMPASISVCTHSFAAMSAREERARFAPITQLQSLGDVDPPTFEYASGCRSH
jgi:hypothetical protein